jgi:hypothetical protein
MEINMTKTETLRPGPALFAGFLAAAAILVIGSYAPLVAVAMKVIG